MKKIVLAAAALCLATPALAQMNPAPTIAPAPTPERLPAVGHRLELVDELGAPIVAIRRRDGSLELHGLADATVLDPVAARALGALASGRLVVRPELLARTDAVLGGLELDWVRVGSGAAAVGRSIEELSIRRRTGVTVVAVLRGAVPVVDPDPSERLRAGDQLVVACRAEDREVLERFLEDGG